MGRKEIETVICSYELLPMQGVMVLKKCVSLHSFDDILLKIPRHLSDISSFQEFKKIVLEKILHDCIPPPNSNNVPALKNNSHLATIPETQASSSTPHKVTTATTTVP